MQMQAVFQKDNHLLATASLALGVISLVTWFVPLCGLEISVASLALGLISRNSSRKNFANAGIITAVIGLVLVSANILLSTYLGFTGILSF